MKSCLVRLGCQISNLEPALFVYKAGRITRGIILCHVDDFLHGGNMEFRKKVMEPLEQEFKASRRVSGQFKVNQNDYLDSVGFEELPHQYVGPEVDLESAEYTLFRSLVGKINWLANGTRLDASFTMINLSTKFKRAHTSHLKEAVKTIKMLKSEKWDIVFPKLNSTQGLKLVMYASLANLNGVDSCGGHIIFLCDDDEKCCVLSWHSGKLKRVVRSTIAAETMALSCGIEEAMYLRQVITFSIGGVLPIIAITDNKSPPGHKFYPSGKRNISG